MKFKSNQKIHVLYFQTPETQQPNIQSFSKRDAYLAEKYRPVKVKDHQMDSSESGYSSLMESGYSSHRESKSSSMNRLDWDFS